MSEPADQSAVTAASFLGPLLVELLGALHDEGVLSPAATKRVIEQWDATLKSWEKRPSMRLTSMLIKAELDGEAAYRLPSLSDRKPRKPMRLSRVTRR